MKIYSLMPFDAFNGSLVEQGLILVAGFKLVIHSLIQGKGKEKSPKWCQLVVTGLTGVNAASAFVWVARHVCLGDPELSKPSRRGDLASKVMRDSTHFN
jgi:hypothetical protein